MILRWFVVCDKDGVKSEPELQFWNKDRNVWESISYVECKAWQEGEFLTDKSAY